MRPTIKVIISDYLREHGYDGLYDDYGECGCEVDDLFPCGNVPEDCRAGYKRLGCTCGGGCDFHIQEPKP
jgi:hypothetical protein